MTVNEVNAETTVAKPGDQTDEVGIPATLAITAADSDVPPNTLTYSDSGTLPPGLVIAPGTGIVSGTPTTAGLYPVTITVTETDGLPTNLSATANFDWEVQLYVASPFAGQIVVNEVLMRTRLGVPEEFVEVYNAGSAAVDLTGWRLLDGNKYIGDFDATPLDVTIPALDLLGAPATLGPGEYAVVWSSTRLATPEIDAPSAALQFHSGAANHWPFDSDGDDIWLLDPAGHLVDYMAWGAAAELDAPPPFGWDGTYQVALAVPANGQSISLTPDGTDTDWSACWEHTTSGDAGGRPECAGTPMTVDSDPVGTRVTSLGSDNNAAGPLTLHLTATGTDQDDLLLSLTTSPYTPMFGGPAVPDYHDGGDGKAGLTLKKSSIASQEFETDDSKFQTWAFSVGDPSGMTIDQLVELRVYSATLDFDITKTGHAVARLSHCSAGAPRHSNGCTHLGAVATINTDPGPWAPSGSWELKTLTFGMVGPLVIPQGDELRVKLVTGIASADDLMFAFDVGGRDSSVELL